MIGIPEFDQWSVEHRMRAARADREGWKRAAARAAGDACPRGDATVVAIHAKLAAPSRAAIAPAIRIPSFQDVWHPPPPEKR